MREKVLFREEIPVPFAKWCMALCGIFAAGFGYALLHQLLVGPVGEGRLPNWYWALMTAVFLGCLFFLRSFRRLVIEITPEHIAVRFGIRYVVPWERMESVRRDERSLLSYGGVGWRFGRRKGGWTMAFVDFRSPRVVLELRGGRVRELVFSTRRPEEVIRLVEEHLSERFRMGESGQTPS
ncbi:hypothetical protein ACVNPS_02360 [Candidatus Bipolaricaulota sp. J31]